MGATIWNWTESRLQTGADLVIYCQHSNLFSRILESDRWAFQHQTVFKPLKPHDLSPLWFYARWMKIVIELLPKSWVTTTRRSQRNYINILFVIKSENNFLPTFSSLKHLCINRPTVFFIFCTIDDWKKKG